jgi:DNA replication factor GINS
MSPALEHMTFDELSELYRVEMNGSFISPARRDLFRAMADLLTRLRGEYEKQLALDPDSVMCEGAEHRKKSAERLCKEVVRIRATKICNMAFLGALGSKNSLDVLTEEERTYYYKILEASKSHLSEVDRLRGKKITVATHIDEVPVRDLPPETREEPFEEASDPAPEEPPADIPEPEDDRPAETPEPEEKPPRNASPPEDFPEPENEFPPEEVMAEWAEEALAPISDVPAEEPDVSLEPVLVRVLEDLPEFSGPERDYRLLKEDVVTMPKMMAEALINTGKAVAVDPSP